MAHLHDAISYYHDLCTQENLAQRSWEMIVPEMAARDLFFGTRPLCTVLRPMFHTGVSWSYLCARTDLMMGVFRKLSDACLADASLRGQLFLTPQEEALVALPTGYTTNVPTARLDSFFTRHDDGDFTLHFIEFNGESPAGMAYNDVLAELFLETPLMQRFGERYHVEPIMSRRHAVDALLRVYYEWRGSYDKLPQIAIVDWDHVPTLSEFRLFVAYFARYGIEATICTPDELDFHDGQMFAVGRPVDFIYKRVLTTELLQRYGLDHPLVEALSAGAVCMVNPFNCKLLHKKASFALVSDERNAHLFSAREQEAIRQHIPWTRIVEDRRTLDPTGATVDLLSYASDHKNELVLKPNDEYGGKGVLIGWECDTDTWESALRGALDEPSIIQARAVIAYEDFPSIDEQGALEISRRLVDCDPFLFHGESVGACLTRLSTVTLLNVTAGGGSVLPAFWVDPKV
ncbi:MAG: hypothetical protein IT328_04900 [Caldilineaceae bacterium]|nr:hypothetical protein [Caldilineaceae bacterium]